MREVCFLLVSPRLCLFQSVHVRIKVQARGKGKQSLHFVFFLFFLCLLFFLFLSYFSKGPQWTRTSSLLVVGGTCMCMGVELRKGSLEQRHIFAWSPSSFSGGCGGGWSGASGCSSGGFVCAWQLQEGQRSWGRRKGRMGWGRMRRTRIGRDRSKGREIGGSFHGNHLSV